MIATTSSNIQAPPQEVLVAVDSVDAAMREIADATIERLKTNASKPGAKLQAGAARVRLNTVALHHQVLAIPTTTVLAPLIMHHGNEWLEMLDKCLETLDLFMRTYQSSSRGHRRDNIDLFRALSNVRRDVLFSKDLTIELLEYYDPTPDDFLDEQIRAIHGDEAETVMAGFSELASSENFSLNAFKQRHNQK